MKKSKDFYKKGYTAGRFLFLYLFVSGLASILVYATLGVFIPLLSGFSMNSLLSAELMYLEALEMGGLTAEESGMFLALGIVVSCAELIPYLLTFILAGKYFGWMKAGFVIYLIDTLVAFLLLISDIGAGAASAPFYIPFILLHLLALGLAGFALYAGGNIFPKRAYAYAGAYQAGGFGNGAFSTLRTLCLIYDGNSYKNTTFTYYINGSPQGTLSQGQTRIIMLDGNYQRIVVSADGCHSKETVVPAGADNVSFTVGVILNDRGEQTVSVLPLVI